MSNTIPDSLAADIRDYFLSDVPEGMEALTADRVRFRDDVTEPPCPRLVILPGVPLRIPSMDGTCKIPVEIKFVSAFENMSPADHRVISGILQTWWAGIRAKRKALSPFTRTYLHDLLVSPPSPDERLPEHDELCTTVRGTMIVTELLLV